MPGGDSVQVQEKAPAVMFVYANEGSLCQSEIKAHE